MGKKKSSNSGSNAASDDVATTKREQPLQAVLLSDSFVSTFRPLSLDRPKMLCPLNNVTMMDYSIDFLAGVGVEELFVVCVSDAVQQHIEKMHQGKHPSMQVTVIKDSSLTNAGDALRELDRRDLIQSDPFILMFGDTVTNVNLTQALKDHKARAKKDRASMMTILFKPVGAAATAANSNKENDASLSNPSSLYTYASIRPNLQDLVVGINPGQENRIVVYDDQCVEGSVAIPCSFFSSHAQVDLHCDWMDCGIYLCSPDVLARFTDEFDYRDILKFVSNSVAEEEEGLQNKIHAHVLQRHEYAARVQDLQTYSAVSRDLLQRWCYPVVPDKLPSGYEKYYRYALQRHYIYQEQKSGGGTSKTRIGRSSLISGPGMIGGSCVVGEECLVEQCVIGNQCTIGSNVSLQCSYLWNNVTVEDGATVVQSVLADGCLIKAGAVVGRGCVIGAGCVVGKGVVLPEFSSVTLAREADDDWDDGWDDEDDGGEKEQVENNSSMISEGSEDVFDKTLVGPDGKGRAWKLTDDDDDEDLYGITTHEVSKARTIGFDPSSLMSDRWQSQQESDDGFSDEEGDDAHQLHGLDKYADSDDVEFGASLPEATATDTIIGRQQGVDVVAELKEICLEYESTSPIENLAIELNSYKFSQNATYSDCVMAAMLAIVDKMEITADTKDNKLLSDFKSLLEHWTPLLQKMGIGVEEEKAIVLALERAAVEDNEVGKVLSSGMSFRLLLQTLHDEEIASEDAVLAWAGERKAEADQDSPRARLFKTKHVQDFLEWLEDESEEDSEEDDDESGDESS